MIFYLSCTGNTRWAAQYLADVTNERMVSIPDAVDGDCVYTLKEGERLGICIPVHGWKLQRMVVDFLSKLQLKGQRKVDYCYVVLTAGDSTGEVMDQLEAMLAEKGIELRAYCGLIMPESYIGLPFMDVDSDLREAEKKMLSRSELNRFADIILDHRSIRMPLVRGYAPRIYSRIIGPFFHSCLITDKRFKVDTSKCIGCGKCVKVCPVGNIKCESGRVPEWQHNGKCLTCFACYHYCPKNAISFWHFTKGKGQYYFEHNKKSSI